MSSSYILQEQLLNLILDYIKKKERTTFKVRSSLTNNLTQITVYFILHQSTLPISLFGELFVPNFPLIDTKNHHRRCMDSKGNSCCSRTVPSISTSCKGLLYLLEPQNGNRCNLLSCGTFHTFIKYDFYRWANRQLN